ncbi:hypothetical protein I3271_03305 [Photobacterium leiognathi]|uniref:hypothetical protein n=1 Tax=Photobacterium leiognathi TaxID=553611 RepID=UPI001EE10E8D|nr:hypothetical protein [Photobacterium leiognathi]MCG3883708.1 hypothetical protein [Photobacterium leiognathi]
MGILTSALLYMLTLTKNDELSLCLSHTFSHNNPSSLSLYIFIPSEVDLIDGLFSEKNFYYASISSTKRYRCLKTDLPLLNSHLLMDGPDHERYRFELSLYVHQAVSNFKIEHQSIISDLKSNKFEYEKIALFSTKLLDSINAIRRQIPKNQTNLNHFKSTDLYLSWFAEQVFLSIAARLGCKGASEIKKMLLECCQVESQYRADQGYGLYRDKNRKANKMKLAELILQRSITLKEVHVVLGSNLDRISKGVVTAIMMSLVSLAVILIRNESTVNTTVTFITLMAALYALRDMFKDDLRKKVRRFIGRNQARWRNYYYDPNSNLHLLTQHENIEFIDIKNLPKEVLKRINCNNYQETIIHFKSSIIAKRHFPLQSAYTQIAEDIYLNLELFARHVPRRTQTLYEVNNGNVVKYSVEKQSVINVIALDSRTSLVKKWRVTLSAFQVVKIENIDEK